MVKSKIQVAFKNQPEYQVQTQPFDNPSKLFDILRNFLIFNPLNRQSENTTGSPASIQNSKLAAFPMS